MELFITLGRTQMKCICHSESQRKNKSTYISCPVRMAWLVGGQFIGRRFARYLNLIPSTWETATTPLSYTQVQKEVEEAGETAQWARVCAVLKEDQGSVPSAHKRCSNSKVCDSSSRCLTPSFGFLGYLHVRVHTHTLGSLDTCMCVSTHTDLCTELKQESF